MTLPNHKQPAPVTSANIKQGRGTARQYPERGRILNRLKAMLPGDEIVFPVRWIRLAQWMPRCFVAAVYNLQDRKDMAGYRFVVSWTFEQTTVIRIK